MHHLNKLPRLPTNKQITEEEVAVLDTIITTTTITTTMDHHVDEEEAEGEGEADEVADEDTMTTTKLIKCDWVCCCPAISIRLHF